MFAVIIELTPLERFWLAVGFLGQLLFTGRFVVQWIASERKQKTVVPTAFWWLSISGGSLLLFYACYRRDPVIITGQLTGLFVYTRNLMIMHRHLKKLEQNQASAVIPMNPQEVRRAG